jgi:hypothetical protein
MLLEEGFMTDCFEWNNGEVERKSRTSSVIYILFVQQENSESKLDEKMFVTTEAVMSGSGTDDLHENNWRKAE